MHGERPLLIVLIGPPGAGKSTWARANADRGVIVSQDDLIDAITPAGFDYAMRPIYAAAEEAIAREALSRGCNVIVDRTNRTRALRERWLNIAREAGAEPIAVWMRTPHDLCIKRNRARIGPRRVSEERMIRMLAAMQRPALDEGFSEILDDSFTLDPVPA